MCTHTFDESYLYQNVYWKYTAATKPITYDDDDDNNNIDVDNEDDYGDDDDDDDDNKMIIIVGFCFNCAAFYLANEIFFYKNLFICSFIRSILILLGVVVFQFPIHVHTSKLPVNRPTN